MLRQIKRTKLIRKIRQKLPVGVRTKVGYLMQWWEYVFLSRFLRKKILATFPVLKKVFSIRPNKGKRILGIWNFASTPPSMGVFIEFEMRLLCMADIYGADRIDIAFIYDPSKPVVSSKYTSWVNDTNFHYHFAEMYPMVNINPKIGSTFLFDSHDKFERFVVQNQDDYILHPTFFAYLRGSDSRPNIPYVREYYLKKGDTPRFKFKPGTIKWVRAFIKKHIGGRIMVAVSLRHNVAYTPNRDSNLKEWEEFFEYCLKKYPEAIFVILGRKNEVDGRIKNLPNMVYSQVENANIEQNLGLIELSLMYMATVFGPASLPILTNYIPFIITNHKNPEKQYDFAWFKEGDLFPWNNPEIQKLVWEPETAGILIREFESIYNNIDTEAWKKGVSIDTIDESNLDWPYN